MRCPEREPVEPFFRNHRASWCGVRAWARGDAIAIGRDTVDAGFGLRFLARYVLRGQLHGQPSCPLCIFWTARARRSRGVGLHCSNMVFMTLPWALDKGCSDFCTFHFAQLCVIHGMVLGLLSLSGACRVATYFTYRFLQLWPLSLFSLLASGNCGRSCLRSNARAPSATTPWVLRTHVDLFGQVVFLLLVTLRTWSLRACCGNFLGDDIDDALKGYFWMGSCPPASLSTSAFGQ